MGTWSTAVNGSDAFGDVATAFDQHLKTSQSLERTKQYVLTSMADYFDDADDRESAYFALADRLWTYGDLNADVLSVVSEPDFGMHAWSDASADQKKKRESAIAAFLAQLRRPNPNPKRLPRIVRRPSKFEPGVCISYRNPDGRYTAGLVTATNNSDPEHGRDLIVLLDYLSTTPPSIADFLTRRWLRTPKGDLMCYWYGPSGHRKIAKNLSVIGTIPIEKGDPQDSNAHADWQGFGPFVIRAKEKLG